MIWLPERHGQVLVDYHRHQGQTNDCGPHVVVLVIHYWYGTSQPVPADIAQTMNRPRWQRGFPPVIVRRIPGWATFPWGIVDLLRAHNIPARWRLWANEQHLLRALAEGRVAMPIFGEPLRRRGWRWAGWSHVAALTGWDAEQAEYWFVDSARHHAPASYSRQEFMRWWRNMGRIMIETL
jgi:hypothetical protein